MPIKPLTNTKPLTKSSRGAQAATSEGTKIQTGTQTPVTVITPVAKKKHWKWRSTGLYHQLIREEEEEGSDQEASLLAREGEEEVIEVSRWKPYSS